MAKMTLLEMTQEILSSMDGDEVNSITDTTEAEQVARIIKRAYTDFITNYDVPELNNVFTLQALGDTSSPTRMQVPTGVDKINWIRYNVRSSTDTKDKFVDVDYVEREEFIRRTMLRDSSATDVVTITENSVSMYVLNDKAPTYFTSFNDDILLFDSYDATVDTTLQASKTVCYGKLDPAFTLSDSFVPTLDSNLFPLVLNEAKSVAFVELKQQANQKAENESRRQRIKMQNDRDKLDNTYDRPDYGR